MVARKSQVEETRRRIMEATLELWVEQPYDLMTLDTIAERAGTTRQTIIRHFGTKDDLATAAGEWRGAQIAAWDHGSEEDPGGALERLVARYEEFGDANARLGDLEGRFAFADESLARGRRNHRAWLQEIFAPSIEAAADEDRRRLVDALYAATDVHVWKLLRRDFGRSQEATRSVIATLVEGALRSVPGAFDALPSGLHHTTERNR